MYDEQAGVVTPGEAGGVVELNAREVVLEGVSLTLAEGVGLVTPEGGNLLLVGGTVADLNGNYLRYSGEHLFVGSGTAVRGGELVLSTGTRVQMENDSSIERLIGGVVFVEPGMQVRLGEAEVDSVRMGEGSALEVQQNLLVRGELVGESAINGEGRLPQLQVAGDLVLEGNACYVDVFNGGGAVVRGQEQVPVELQSVNMVLGRQLQMEQVTVAGASRFASTSENETLSIQLSDVTFMLSDSNTQALPIPETLTFTCITPLFGENAEVSGSLTLDFSAWESALEDNACDVMTLTFGSNVQFAENCVIQGRIGSDRLLEAPTIEGNTLTFVLTSGGGELTPPEGELTPPALLHSDVVIGKEGGMLSDTDAALLKDQAHITSLRVLSGSFTVEPGLSFGEAEEHNTTKISIGSASASEPGPTAALVNRGTVIGSLELLPLATVVNEGNLILTEGDDGSLPLHISAGSSLQNSGNLELAATAEQGDATALELSDDSVLHSSGVLNISASATGGAAQAVLLRGNAALENSGSLSVNASGDTANEVTLRDSSTLHLLHNSVSSFTTLSGDGTATLCLGGVRLDSGEEGTTEGGSRVTHKEDLTISGVSLALADDVALAMAGNKLLLDAVQGNLREHVLSFSGAELFFEGNSRMVNGLLRGENGAEIWLTGESMVERIEAGTVRVANTANATIGTGTVKLLNVGYDSVLTTTGDICVSEVLVGGRLPGLPVPSAEMKSEGHLELNGNVERMKLLGTSINFVSKTTVPSNIIDVHASAETIRMENAMVLRDSRFSSSSSEPLDVDMKDVTFVLDDSNSEDATPGGTLTCTLDTQFFSDAALNGSLSLDLTGWVDEVLSGGYEKLAIEMGSDVDFAEELAVSGFLEKGEVGAASALENGVVTFNVVDISSLRSAVDTDGAIQLPVDAGQLTILPVEPLPGQVVDASLGPQQQILPAEIFEKVDSVVVTGEEQVLQITSSQDVNYSVAGTASSETPQVMGKGATIVVSASAEEPGTGADVVRLNGDYYNCDIRVENGTAVSSADTTLGARGMTVTLGAEDDASGSRSATLINQGTVAGDMVMHGGSEVINSGRVAGDVEVNDESQLLSQGATYDGEVVISEKALAKGTAEFNVVTLKGAAYVGNSPGYWSVSAINFHEGANITFCIDGFQAATPTHYGEGTGTYSQLHVEDTLTFTGSSAPTVTLEIGAGIVKGGLGEKTITLMTFGSSALASLDAAKLQEMFATPELTGRTDLLGEHDIEWNGSTLMMTLEVSPAAVAALFGGDGSAIANTLWSSTSAVRSFARVATAQLATPPVEVGGVTVWGSALGDYVSMSGFRSNAHGYAVGADKQFCPHVRTGIALGQMFGDFTADRGLASVEQDSVMVGLYSEYLRELDKTNIISFTSYAAYGRVENDADTRVGGSAELPGTASWDDDVFSLGTRIEWNIRMTEKTSLTPFIGMEYLYGSQENFTERFAGESRQYSDGSMQVWRMPVGITARTVVELGDGQSLLPELTLAYVGDVARKDPHVRSSVYGISSCSEGTKPGRSAFMMNVGANWMISRDWSVGASYNLETRSHEVSQEANISVRYTF